jgi:predicted PurR-regulated permease PerM
MLRGELWWNNRACRYQLRGQPVSSSSNESERKQTAEVGEEAMSVPVDAKVIFLGGIFFVIFLAALYVVADIVWPLVLAFVLSLLLKPPMRLLARLRLRFLEAPFATLQHFWQQIENFAGWQESANSSAGSTLLTKLFTGTRSFASGFFTTLLFLFFLLVAGDIFLQRLVEIMPRFSSKRQVVDIAKQIESDISAYLLTITAMNASRHRGLSCGLPELPTPFYGER